MQVCVCVWVGVCVCVFVCVCVCYVGPTRCRKGGNSLALLSIDCLFPASSRSLSQCIGVDNYRPWVVFVVSLCLWTLLSSGLGGQETLRHAAMPFEKVFEPPILGMPCRLLHHRFGPFPQSPHPQARNVLVMTLRAPTLAFFLFSVSRRLAVGHRPVVLVGDRAFDAARGGPRPTRPSACSE